MSGQTIRCPGCPLCMRAAHPERFCFEEPAPIEDDAHATETRYVVDRNAVVWFLPPEYDGGMATRADATGVISAGIAWLERDAGPLLPFDPVAYRRAYPRSEAKR